MGRPRKHRKDLPERVYYNHGAYYHVDDNNKWHNLGRDYPQAMLAWAKLIESPASAVAVAAVVLPPAVELPATAPLPPLIVRLTASPLLPFTQLLVSVRPRLMRALP